MHTIGKATIVSAALAVLLLFPALSFAPGVPGQQAQGRSFVEDPALLNRLGQLWIIAANALVALEQSTTAEGLWSKAVYYTPPAGWDLSAFELDPTRRIAVLSIVHQDPGSPRMGPVQIKVLRLDLQSGQQSELFATAGSYNAGVTMVAGLQLAPNGALAVQTELRSQRRCLVYLPDGRPAFNGTNDWVERCAGFSPDGRLAFGSIDSRGQGPGSYLRSVDLASGKVETYAFPGQQAVDFLARQGVAVASNSSPGSTQFRVVRIPELDELERRSVEGFAAPLDCLERRLPFYAMTDDALLSWEQGASIGLPGPAAQIQLLVEHPTRLGYLYLRRDLREVDGFSMDNGAPESFRLFSLESDDPYAQSNPTLVIEQARAKFQGELGALQLIGRQWNRLFLIDLAAGTYYEVIAPLPEKVEAAWYRLDRKAVAFFR